MVSFSMLSGKSKSEEASSKSRALVLKSLTESATTPYLGVLISGVPRLAKVKNGSLSKPKKLANFPSVFREVTLGEEQVLIPDMDELTRLIEAAVTED